MGMGHFPDCHKERLRDFVFCLLLCSKGTQVPWSFSISHSQPLIVRKCIVGRERAVKLYHWASFKNKKVGLPYLDLSKYLKVIKNEHEQNKAYEEVFLQELY